MGNDWVIIMSGGEGTRLRPFVHLIWSDWGRAERIAESLAQIGRQPLFKRERARKHSAA